jgi:beta-N-acetylhexosaminidase
MRKDKYRNRRRRQFFIIFLVIFIFGLITVAGFMALQKIDSISRGDNLEPSNTSEAAGLSHSTGSTAAGSTSAPEDDSGSSAASPDTAGHSEEVDPVKEQIENMTLEEKIGQLVIVGADGYNIDANSKQMIEKYHVGGFILFKRNIQDSKQMLDLLNSMKGTNRINKIPLFLSIDEEGGRVSRLPDEFVKFPANKEIGKLNNSDLSRQVGSIIGEELTQFGMNMDFAPVLDINSNPKNPVIGDRSFGTDPGIVSKLGVQTMKGIQSKNIISVVKHFPGHGDTSTDSHVGLPRVNNNLERLKGFELKPFAEAIKNGADAVMVAHILLPQIDPGNPASFSKTIISDVLRRDMKFDGVVITDDFTMGAIVQNYNIGQAAVKSIQAGSDIVLVCHDFDKQTAVISALKMAADTGKLTMERIDESVYRILKLKEKYGISDNPAESVDSKAINTKINALFK